MKCGWRCPKVVVTECNIRLYFEVFYVQNFIYLYDKTRHRKNLLLLYYDDDYHDDVNTKEKSYAAMEITPSILGIFT